MQKQIQIQMHLKIQKQTQKYVAQALKHARAMLQGRCHMWVKATPSVTQTPLLEFSRILQSSNFQRAVLSCTIESMFTLINIFFLEFEMLLPPLLQSLKCFCLKFDFQTLQTFTLSNIPLLADT